MVRTIEELCIALKNKEESYRCDAILELKELNSSLAISLLFNHLSDESPRIREVTADALVEIGGIQVALMSLCLLRSEKVVLRNVALEIVQQLGIDALSVLKDNITSPISDIRIFTVETIGKIIAKRKLALDQELLSALIERLGDENVNVAGVAAEALGFAKENAAIPALLQYVVSGRKSSWLQCNIIVALSRIGSGDALTAIKGLDRKVLSEEAIVYLEMVLKGEVL
ncbi:MAG: HEAT repeat domain-containing protein [Oligoflexia bacterium]|nr:HEAT repeat domain-containing protein [Oligoflexia bacterium]MBF0366967.1 HEAT repeat domain-containing protein [Oligoflexia bacterium]